MKSRYDADADVPAAMCDFEPTSIDYARPDGGGDSEPVGKDQPRLQTSDGPRTLSMRPADKIIGRVRTLRPDIVLVGFKTTSGAAPQAQFEAGASLLERGACSLVLANDIKTHRNIIVTPGPAFCGETTNRHEVISLLVKMAIEQAKVSA